MDYRWRFGASAESGVWVRTARTQQSWTRREGRLAKCWERGELSRLMSRSWQYFTTDSQPISQTHYKVPEPGQQADLRLAGQPVQGADGSAVHPLQVANVGGLLERQVGEATLGADEPGGGRVLA